MLKYIYAFYLLKVGQHYFQNDEVDKGICILEKAIKFASDYHFAYFHLACKLIEIGELSKAEAHINKALEIQPQNSIYHTYLGIIKTKVKEYEKAEESFQKAIGIDPYNQLTYNYLALNHLKQGNLKTFREIITDKGIFENSDVQIEILLSLEHYRRIESS